MPPLPLNRSPNLLSPLARPVCGVLALGAILVGSPAAATTRYDVTTGLKISGEAGVNVSKTKKGIEKPIINARSSIGLRILNKMSLQFPTRQKKVDPNDAFAINPNWSVKEIVKASQSVLSEAHSDQLLRLVADKHLDTISYKQMNQLVSESVNAAGGLVGDAIFKHLGTTWKGPLPMRDQLLDAFIKKHIEKLKPWDAIGLAEQARTSAARNHLISFVASRKGLSEKRRVYWYADNYEARVKMSDGKIWNPKPTEDAPKEMGL